MKTLRALLSFSLLTVGCADAAVDGESVDVTDDAVIAAEETFENPEIGLLRQASSYCTATLIRPNVVLTAAHCIAGGHKDVPIAGFWFEVRAAAGEMKRFEIDRAFTLPVASDFDGSQTWRLKDVALMRLSTPVPADVATPRTIATQRPTRDTPVAIYGYGCTSRTPDATGKRPGGGTKRVADFAWSSTTPGSGATSHVCPGDSGGPWLDLDSGAVFGTTSGFVNADDRFGDLPAHAAELDAIADAWSL